MIKESGLSLAAARQRTVINSGDYFFQTMKEGETLRIVDLEGNQAADVLFFNAEDPSERYSMSDTLREQAAIYLTAGTMLKTNLNRDLLEIVADTCGRHDTLGGACATESNRVIIEYCASHSSGHNAKNKETLSSVPKLSSNMTRWLTDAATNRPAFSLIVRTCSNGRFWKAFMVTYSCNI